MPRWWNHLRGLVGKKTHRVKTAYKRRFGKSTPKPLPRLSMAAHAFSVNPQHYRLETRSGWTYQEAHLQPVQGYRHFTPTVSPLPHMVLRDAFNTPRYTLSFRLLDGKIQLEEIQRCHTLPWLSADEHPLHHAQRETQASKEFQARLNGVYPPEFMLIHFLAAHKADILAGKKVIWRWSVFSDYFPANHLPNQLYPALAKHYFKRVGSKPRENTDHVAEWELDLSKLRTREALGLPPQKKK